MKKMAGVVFSLLFLFSLAASALANEPQDIQLEWDAGNHTLAVSVAHRTHDAKRHYIRRIDVTVNGKRVESRSFEKQPDNKGLFARIPLNHLPKDAIVTVKAYCNLGGAGKESLKISRSGDWKQINPGQPGGPQPTHPYSPGRQSPVQPGNPGGPEPNQPDPPKNPGGQKPSQPANPGGQQPGHPPVQSPDKPAQP
jgi:desulfoferrodoxin (superoxide reductase-like protein)